jgi:hypothetical protein
MLYISIRFIFQFFHHYIACSGPLCPGFLRILNSASHFKAQCTLWTLVMCRAHSALYTAKTQYRKFETKIPRKGIAWPLSQCPHSCVCEPFINSQDRSAYSVAGKYVDWSWEYINGSQTHECGIGTEATLFLVWEYINGIFVAVQVGRVLNP